MRYLSYMVLIVCMCITASYNLQSAFAQDPVEALSDLVGAKAGQAENAVKDRGYTWVKTDKSGGSAYSYWTESGSGKCVTIRTEDGRYQSIVYATKFDCRKSRRTAAANTNATKKVNCKLYNKKSDEHYDGSCTVNQGYGNYDVTLANGNLFHFVEQGSGYKVQTKKGWSSHKVSKTVSGSSTEFKWGKWQLIVESE